MNEQVNLGGICRMELRRWCGQRSLMTGLFSGAALLIVIATLTGMAFAQVIQQSLYGISDLELRSLPSFGLPFAVLAVGFACSTFVTSEWSSGSMMTSVATTQRRGSLVVAKALVAGGAAGLVLGLSGLIATALANLTLANTNRQLPLNDALMWRSLGGVVFSSAAIGVIAVGLGFLFRRTALSLVSFVAIMSVLPIVLAIIPVSSARRIEEILPTNAATAVTNPTNIPLDGTPSFTGGIVILAVWAVGLSLAGWWRMTRSR